MSTLVHRRAFLIGSAAAAGILLMPKSRAWAQTARTRLTANLDLFVSPSGSDTTGDGSSGNPFLTREEAFGRIHADYDFAGKFGATVNLADGTYADEAELAYQPVGFGHGSFLKLKGNLTTPGNVIISGLSEIEKFAALQVEGVRFTGKGPSVYDNAYMETTGPVELGLSTSWQLYAYQHGGIRIGAPLSIIAGANSCLRVGGNGSITANGQTISLIAPPTGNLAYGFAFAFAERNGSITLQTATINGTGFAGCQGVRWRADRLGSIACASNPETFLPGHLAGIPTFGGVAA